MESFLAPLALILDRAFGYPRPLFRAIGHPVTWMGALIGYMEPRFNAAGDSAMVRRNGGILMLVVLILATLAASALAHEMLRWVPFGWIIEAMIASALLAQKDLGRAVRAVADALDVSLAEGRRAVSAIVGRDTDTLDTEAVSRAAVESLAESSSDGVVAPLFWLLLLGLPGIAVYKAINTADSMVGHKDDRYLHFGWASARLDDLVNWIPARLTALLVAGAAMLVPGADAERAWSTALRDAPKHESPNAGWPEAAMAGALGFCLGGPRMYGGKIVDLPAFGSGRDALGPADIRRALDLYGIMLNVLLGAVLVIAVAQWRAWS